MVLFKKYCVKIIGITPKHYSRDCMEGCALLSRAGCSSGRAAMPPMRCRLLDVVALSVLVHAFEVVKPLALDDVQAI